MGKRFKQIYHKSTKEGKQIENKRKKNCTGVDVEQLAL